MHGPFVPFSIIFTRAVQLLDAADLARLDLFAATLQYSDADSPESITHPYRLYEPLCQGARLFFDWNTTTTAVPFAAADPSLTDHLPESFGGFDDGQAGLDAANETLGPDSYQIYGLSDWYYSNQQMMSLFEDDAIF